MRTTASLTSHHAELLETLKGHSFLADHHLTLYCRAEGEEAPGWRICDASEDPPLCKRLCAADLDDLFLNVVTTDRPKVFRCPVGVLCFAVPLHSPPLPIHMLVGSGRRSASLNFFHIEALAKAENIDPFALLEQLQNLPVATEQEVDEVAQKVYRLVAPPSEERPEKPPAPPVEMATDRLTAVAAMSAEIDKAETVAETASLLSETIGIVFDIAAIAMAIPCDDWQQFYLHGTWGLPVERVILSGETLRKTFPQGSAERVILNEYEIRELFPGVAAHDATCIPLIADGYLLGVVALFNAELENDEYFLIALLTGRAATRLIRLKREGEFARKSSFYERLIAMISTLALSEEKEELFRQILEMCVELVQASCGSFMLINDDGESLRIETAVGMNLQLARTMSVKMGKGIAGKVAVSGNPLLVNDIEKDNRIATTNRPRFKTKSFISMPLTFKGETLGVLNLSDKKNQGIFTEADLEVLTPFVGHASAMIERMASLEKAHLFERLSITDPLTELYNRRFLEKRMEEELNRSLRTDLHLTVMIIDLDHFKIYNDICGHIAGDRALKKIAKILKSSVRDMDVVTRYGGEEFCILLPGTSKKESYFVAERIRRSIEHEMFPGEEHLPSGRLTASIGISSFPDDGKAATALINVADIALYQAKSEGRNRIVIFNDTAKNDPVEISYHPTHKQQ